MIDTLSDKSPVDLCLLLRKGSYNTGIEYRHVWIDPSRIKNL